MDTECSVNEYYSREGASRSEEEEWSAVEHFLMQAEMLMEVNIFRERTWE